MASDQLIEELKDLATAILSIDREKLLRAALGELALQEEFSPALEKIEKKVDFALEYAPEVHELQVQNILSAFEDIRAEMEQQANHSNSDYVAHRPQFLANIAAQLEALKEHWPPIVTAAVESRGFLEDEGVRQEYERTIESIKSESENALQQVQEEARKTIEEARTLAEQIENRARSTASGISMEEAQDQFREAQTALDKRVKIWAGLGIASVLGFIGVAIYFATVDLPDQWRWQVIYHSAIRVSILTAIGTAAAFCLKILRAHLHMSEKNRHRQHVANSMEAFVQSAVTPEQRDLILSQLVESIVQFGNSGLVQREDDNVYRPKMTIDSITRTLSTNPQKEV